MNISFADPHEITCPLCHHTFHADVWLLVDIKEHPELVEPIQAETIHEVQCPHDHLIALDAPLLLIFPHDPHTLIFSPAEQTTADQDQAHFEGLLELLQAQVGHQWYEGWVKQVQLIERYALASTLKEALHLEPEGKSVPPTTSLLINGEELSTLSTEDQAVRHYLNAFFYASSWTAAQTVVEAHPELLDDKAMKVLQYLIEEARAQNNTDATPILEEHLAVLQACGTIGIAQAFAEKLVSASRSMTIEQPAELTALLHEAAAQTQRYLQTNILDDVDRAISLWNALLQSPNYPTLPVQTRSALLNNAGAGYLHRYRIIGDEVDLTQAVDLWQAACDLNAPSTPDRLALLNNLGASLSMRFAHSGDTSDLHRALAVHEEAVASSPPDDPDRAMYLTNLGASLSARFASDGNSTDLERALEVFQQSLDSTLPNTPDHALRLNNLGNALRTRFVQSGSILDSERAIEAFQKAVDNPLISTLDRAMYLSNLGVSLRDRFTRSDNITDLERAIEAFQQALDCTPPTTPDRAARLSNLATGLNTRFAHTGNSTDLEQAIVLYQEAVNCTPFTSPARAAHLSNLGSSLRKQYIRTDNIAYLERAIRLHQEAIDGTPSHAPDRINFLDNLGNSLFDRFERSGDVTDMERAIHIFEEALNLTLPNSPNRATHLINLSNGLSARFSHSGDTFDLERAIEISQQALELTSLAALARAALLTNLGLSLRSRFGRSGDVNDLERAIHNFQEAVGSTSPDAPNYAKYLTNLGLGLSDRFTRTGNASDLERAITVYEQAIDIIPTSAPGRAILLNNLGLGLRDRFDRRGDPADLERMILFFQQAVDSTPPHSPDNSTFLSNLGSAFNLRFARNDNITDLEKAIEAFQHAVDSTPLDAPDRAARLSNLATGLSSRFFRTGDPTDLEQAIILYQKAVNRTPLTSPDRAVRLSNLSDGLRERYTQHGNASDLNQATTYYREASRVALEVKPALAVWSGRSWGDWALARCEWTEATEAYGYSLEALERLYVSQSLLTDRESWLRELAQQPQNAAFALAKQGDLKGAITVLEQGRTRLLRESMERDVAELATVQTYEPILVAEYQRAAHRVRLLERQERLDIRGVNNPDLRHEARVARDALEQAIAAIRALPGYDNFLRPPNFKTVLEMAQPNSPLIYLVTTPAGSLMLVVALIANPSSYEITALWAEDFTLKVLNNLLVKRNEASNAIIGGYLLGQFESQSELSDSLAPLLTKVGQSLITPLVAHLRKLGAQRVTLIPTGRLTLLPLHGATHTLDPEPRDLLNEFEIAFVPSVTVLQSIAGTKPYPAESPHLIGIGNPLPGLALGVQARDTLRRLREPLSELQERAVLKGEYPVLPKLMLSMLLRLMDSAPEVILKAGGFLGEAALQLSPVAPEITHALATLALPLLTSLPHAKAEVQSIVALFPPGQATVYYESEATASALWQSLPHTTIAHFACHGRFDATSPLDSALYLAGGERLTLRDLFATDPLTFRAIRLVVLSACQTAITDFINLSDEGLGLPAGFLQAGIPAVVGSLWPVKDFSTALLMVRFYELLNSANEGEDNSPPYSPPRALRAAQCWLREATEADLDRFVQRHPALQKPEARWEGSAICRPFADPYYWAAFVYLGVL